MQGMRQWLLAIDGQLLSWLGPPHAMARSLPWMLHPAWAVALSAAYLLIVVLAVPTTMRLLRIPPLRMKPMMRAYNLFMVALSSYMGIHGLRLWYALYFRRQLGPLRPLCVWCVPLELPGAADATLRQWQKEMAALVWLFTWSKVVEFADTLFMVLEGRMRQVSFLHVYHHVTMFLYWFVNTYFYPGGDLWFSLVQNAFVHTVMYGYYFATSFGYNPRWKYWITYGQMLQFVFDAMQSIVVGYAYGERVCGIPDRVSRGLLWYMLSMLALFAHFLLTSRKSKALRKVKTA